MATRKGIAVTVLALAAVTGGSFAFWLVPGPGSGPTFVVTDYESYLDGAKNIRDILQESTDLDYMALQDGGIEPSKYAEAADATSSQVTAQISELVTTKPPAEWQESYINYMESLRKFNEYVTETKVLAAAIESGSPEQELAGIRAEIAAIKAESEGLARASDGSRPG